MKMQLKTISAIKDVPFGGVEFVKTDKKITEVIVGGKLRIRMGESYTGSLVVLIEQPFEEAKKFRLTATIDGFGEKVSYHDSKYEADIAGAALEEKGASIAVEEVAVQINDQGEIVGATDGSQPAQPIEPESDFPF